MATFTAITNAQIDPDSPLTTGLATQWRDNHIASHKYVPRAAVGPDQTGSAVLADDTVLEFAADASQAYHVVIFGNFATTEVRGIRMAIDAPAGSTVYTALQISETTNNAATNAFVRGGFGVGIATAIGGVIGANVGAETYAFHLDSYVLVAGAAGDIKLQYAQWSAGAATCQTLAGCALVYHRIDAV